MNVLATYIEQDKSLLEFAPHLSFHSSFASVYQKLKKWQTRYSSLVDHSIFNDLSLLYLLATKKYFDHRNASHLFRLVLSTHLMQKSLLRKITFSPQSRHLEIRWIQSTLNFPFFNKPVLGCLIGFNILDRYELFDEENVILTLQKYFPHMDVVKESSYCHTSQHKDLKIFYLEIEKKEGSFFSPTEKKCLKAGLEKKIKNTIQRLSPTIFMGFNEEEIYKNILVLSQEIHSLQDLPQAYITLDQQTGKEIIFRVNLVHISPFHRFSLKDRFSDCTFISERILTVKRIENHPVEAHIFRLCCPRDAALLRSDGSLDFYLARQKVVSSITAAIGEFRDFNGGIIFKQQELFFQFKEKFPEAAQVEIELMEVFFYSLTPIEKQVLLDNGTLFALFEYFLENRAEKLLPTSSYSFKTYRKESQSFLMVHGEDPSLKEVLSSILQTEPFEKQDVAYNILDLEEGVFFNCAVLTPHVHEVEVLSQTLQEALIKWQEKIKSRQILKIGFEYSLVSLDPRIGGEAVSGDVLRFLFEGLTRFDQNGNVENGVADSIEISPNLKEYIFKFRRHQWNDGTLVSAYDFEYAWKKVLSPDFKTSFAYFFYPIKNAREAKDGKVDLDAVGIKVINDQTLKVTLAHPAPYFLQLTAHPVYSPIHRLIDQQRPQWPYEAQRNYPCNGPFQLRINQLNQGYHLIKNPFYWDTNHISWDQVILTRITNSAQALQAFHKGEIDWVGNPLIAWDPSFIPQDEDRIVSFPNSWIGLFIFNNKKPPFNHLKMRQALAYAIQRSEIVKDSSPHLNPAYSPLLPSNGNFSNFFFPEHDAEKANQLFYEVLKELGLSKKELPVFDLCFHHKGIREHVALQLKKQLKECLGIECNLKPVSWASLFDKICKGNFEMGLSYWNSWLDDPIYTLNAFKFATEEINFSKWEHPEFQQFLDLSDEVANPFQRSYYLFKAEEILCKEMPFIPLFYQPCKAMTKKNLQLFYRAPCGPFNLARSYYKKKEVL